jgi:hypothetical protein
MSTLERDIQQHRNCSDRIEYEELGGTNGHFLGGKTFKKRAAAPQQVQIDVKRVRIREYNSSECCLGHRGDWYAYLPNSDSSAAATIKRGQEYVIPREVHTPGSTQVNKGAVGSALPFRTLRRARKSYFWSFEISLIKRNKAIGDCNFMLGTCIKIVGRSASFSSW